MKLSGVAVAYQVAAYYFAGIKVESRIENDGRDDVTFDLAKVDVVGRDGRVGRPCLVWSEPVTGQRVRLYPPEHPWYAGEAGCPIPEGRYLVTIHQGDRAVFTHTFDTDALDSGLLGLGSQLRPPWRSLRFRNWGLTVSGKPVAVNDVLFQVESR